MASNGFTSVPGVAQPGFFTPGDPGSPSVLVSVVNTWTKPITGTGASGTNGYIYGTGNMQISNTPGNWLFAIVQWDETNIDPDTVVWLADDAHNFWQHVKLSAPGHTLRTAILVATNAIATPRPDGTTRPGLTTVYLSSNGFIRNPILTVIEVSGMQPGYVIELAGTVYINSNSITLSGTIPSADFVLAAATHRFSTASNPTISAGTGWTQIAQTVSNTADGNVLGIQGISAWQFMPNGGSPSITFSQTDTRDWTGVMIAVKAGAGLPVNPSNPAWPIITVQAAFGVLPGSASDAYTWTDISSRFLGLKGSRGRDYELDQLSSANFTINLDNRDGGLNPFNASGPYYPNVKLITPIRVVLSWQGRTYRIFEGQIEFLPASYEEQFGVIQTECYDTFAKLPQVRLQSAMCQEIMYDNPQFFWPMGDASGSSFASNLSGVTFTGLDFVASKFGHGGATADFGKTPVPTLKGSQDTVFQQSGVAILTPWKGYTLRCFDENLPGFGTAAAYEFWFNLPTSGVTNPGGFFTLEGNTVNSGGILVQLSDSTGSLILQWIDGTGTIRSVSTGLASNYEDGLWHHYFMALTGTSITLYIDGVSVLTTGTTTFGSTNVQGVELFGVTNRFVNNQTPVFCNGQASNLAAYNYIPEIERIQEHASSGLTGFANEDTGQRVMRLLRYADWGKPQAVDSGISLAQRLDYMGGGLGYGSGGIGSAFGLFGSFGPQHPTGAAGASGTQADLAVQDMGLTENGSVFVDRNGTLFFKNRDNLYNGGVRGRFTDTFFPLNKNYQLADQSNWTPQDAFPLTSGSSVWKLGGALGSMLLTASGYLNPTVVSEHISVSASTSHTLDTWLMVPAGWTNCRLAINWYDSSNTFISVSAVENISMNPMTPLPLSITATSPSNASFGQISIQFVGVPPPGTQFVICKPTLSTGGFAVPFLGDVIVNFDVSFLYNDILVTRNVDEAFARVVDPTSKGEYFTRTYTRTVYLPGSSDSQSVADNANWVLNAYKEPKYRVETMNVDMASNPDSWEQILRLDVGDVVFFSRTAPGTVPVSGFFVILKIEPEIDQDLGTISYSLGPILNPVFTLDDPATGLIGSSFLGY